MRSAMQQDEPGTGYAVFRTGDDGRHTLVHGDLVGRLWSAALHLNDGRVSECHAMVSNRGRELHLLALRGRFRVDGEVRRQVALEAGQRIELAPGLWIGVEEVRPPESVLAVRAPGLPERVVAGVVSLSGDPVSLRPGWVPDAPCRLWPTGEGWMRSCGGPPEPLEDGHRWEVQGTVFEARLLHSGGIQPTEDNQLAQRLVIVDRYDVVSIRQEPRGTQLQIGGLSARLISELAAVGQPVDWYVLASELWDAQGRELLRKRWDMQISRLRRKLRAAGIRSDLVSSDGSGLVHLLLGPLDQLVDET